MRSQVESSTEVRAVFSLGSPEVIVRLSGAFSSGKCGSVVDFCGLAVRFERELNPEGAADVSSLLRGGDHSR